MAHEGTTFVHHLQCKDSSLLERYLYIKHTVKVAQFSEFVQWQKSLSVPSNVSVMGAITCVPNGWSWETYNTLCPQWLVMGDIQ